MEFDWHEPKRQKTLAERGLDFAEVFPAFFDPRRLIIPDERREYGEPRWNLFGQVNGRLFHVTFTIRGEVTWIISARKANDREQRRYDNRQR